MICRYPLLWKNQSKSDRTPMIPRVTHTHTHTSRKEEANWILEKKINVRIYRFGHNVFFKHIIIHNSTIVTVHVQISWSLESDVGRYVVGHCNICILYKNTPRMDGLEFRNIPLGGHHVGAATSKWTPSSCLEDPWSVGQIQMQFTIL